MAGVIEEVKDAGLTLTGWIHTDADMRVPEVVVSSAAGGSARGTVQVVMIREDVLEVTHRPGAAVEIHLQHPIDLLRFCSGEFSFSLSYKDGETEEMRVAPEARLHARAIAEGMLQAMPLAGARSERLDVVRPGPNDRMSYIEMPAGVRDPRGAVTLGLDGWVFLSEGSNELTRQYGPFRNLAERSKLLDSPLSGWSRIIEARANFATAVGSVFRQLILPEKNSCLAELCFDRIDPPTPLYQALVSSESLRPLVVDGFKALRKEPDQRLLWTRNDNHMDCFGVYLAVKALLESLGLTTPLSLSAADFSEGVYRRGNIAGEILGVTVWDKLRLPSAPSIAGLRDPLLLADSSPDAGSAQSHVGSSRSWRNESAPIDASLVLFGSSTANMGESPAEMSWWLSRLFRSYEFRWTSNFETDRLTESTPEFVVSQTAERFLVRVPLV